MKFYRVATFVEHGNSAGFSWHTSRREAEKYAADSWRATVEAEKELLADPLRGAGHSASELPPEIELVEIEPTRGGILRALNMYATHPDNG